MLRQLPRLTKELARVRLALAKKEACIPWKLEFFTTYSCQSRCKTCLIWTRYEREPERRVDELTPRDFAKIAQSVAKHLCWISFTGGELTERDDALELVTRVLTNAPRARVISTSSHGLEPERVEHLFDAVAARFPERAIMVTLSLDGLRDSYKKIRGVDGFDQVLESMDRLTRVSARRTNLVASFQTTLSAGNLHEAGDIIETINKRVSGNVVTLANDSRVLTEGKVKGVDVRDDDRLDDTLNEINASLGWLSFSDWMSRIYLKLLRNSGTSEAPIPCAAGLASLTISPYGEVLQCDRHDAPLGILSAPDFDLSSLIDQKEFRKNLAPWIGCVECFTPCQAYPSIMQAPIHATKAALLGP